MALVPLPENPPGLLGRYAARFSRKQFDGLVVDPVKAGSHHPGVLMAHGAEETIVGIVRASVISPEARTAPAPV